MKKVLCALALLLAGLVAGEAQISIPNSFTPGTTINSSQVNANFTAVGTNSLNRTGGTMTGTLTAQVVNPDTDNTRDMGDGTHRFRALYLVDGTHIVSFDAGNLSTGTIPNGRFPATLPAANGSALTNLTAGNVVYTLASKSAIYTAVTTDQLLTASGTFTITLYTCASNGGKWVEIKNTGTGVITVATTASQTIDGASTQTINQQYSALLMVCDGTNWNIF